MDELISVIVPIYNVEKQLKRCINSIINQTYKNIQILLIDDGSKDSSGKICDNFSKYDTRIIVLHQDNTGVSAARNKGIELAEGRYICFIDSDDYIEKNYIEELHQLMKDEKIDLGICDLNYKYTNKEDCWSTVGKKTINLKNVSEEIFLELNEKYLLYGPYNKIFKSSIIKKQKIRFIKEMSYGEDLIFNLSYLQYVKIIKTTNQTRYNYIADIDNSLANKYRADRFKTGKIIFEELYKFFEINGMLSEKSKKYLYGRIFDDAYNNICECVKNQSCKESLKEIKKILFDQKIKESYAYIDNRKYSANLIKLIHHKKIVIIYIYIKMALKNIN